jgi:hypothetical protein
LITGDRFRVSYEVDFTNNDDRENEFFVEIRDDSGALVGDADPDSDDEDSFIVFQGPGEFEIDVDVEPDDGATYTLIVEDCTGNEPADNGDGGGDDGGDTVECADFSSQADAQAALADNPSLDTDGDGRACQDFFAADQIDDGSGGGAAADDLSSSGGDNNDLTTDARRDAAELSCVDIVEISQSASRDQYNFSAVRLQECLAREVIGDVKADKLADTGGPPLLALAALLLVGAGIFVGRAVLSRRDG